jgi:hypothetical protein
MYAPTAKFGTFLFVAHLLVDENIRSALAHMQQAGYTYTLSCDFRGLGPQRARDRFRTLSVPADQNQLSLAIMTSTGYNSRARS